jgi:hypothetical protein
VRNVKAKVIKLIHRLGELYHIVVLMYFLTSIVTAKLADMETELNTT